MQNLIEFIIRFHNFLLFLVLEFFCILLVVQNNNYQGAGFFAVTEAVTNQYNRTVDNTVEYFSLKEQNDSLQAENARLRNRLKTSFYNLEGNIRFERDSLLEQHYSYVPADVIRNSVKKRNNYLIINKGSIQNIRDQLGVIGQHGVIGIVRKVSPRFSSVISVLHKDFRVSGRVLPSDAIGSVSWDGKDPNIVVMSDLPAYAELKKGQAVVTSNYSEIFPPNIPIGTIERFEVREGDNFGTAYIRLAESPDNIMQAYVVVNRYQAELEELSLGEVPN